MATPIAICVFAFATVVAHSQASDLLRNEYWREHAHGISLHPPAHAQLFVQILDDTVPWTLGTSGTKQMALQDLRASLRLDPIRERLKQNPQANQELLDQIGNRTKIAPLRSARLLAHSTSNALLRMEGDLGYSITLYVRNHKGMHIDQIAAHAIGQVGANWPSARILREQKIEAAGQSGRLLYYNVPQPNRDDAALGQAFVPIHDESFALLRLDVPFVLFEDVRPIFEAVVNSLAVEDPLALAQQRAKLIENGVRWRETLDNKRCRMAAGHLKLLRIIQGGADIGYMTIEMRRARELNLPGLAAIVQARIRDGQYVYDTKSQFFLSEDSTHELWKINTTARPRNEKPQKPKSDEAAQVTWAETGLRFEDQINVTRHDSVAATERTWQVPAGYISQVELHLLDMLLPHDSQKELGFYAYLPSANKITYRTVQIEPATDGSCRLLTRPSPERGQSIAQYDPQGKFQGRWFPGGRVMVPTNADQLKRIWQVER